MTEDDLPPRGISNDMEDVLQRIFNESDPAQHRAALWDLLGHSDDWELFERLQSLGAQRSMDAYFRNLLDQFDEAADATGIASDDEREQIREMYAAPLLCLHHGDLAGSAAAMHEILLNEIYHLYNIGEDELAFADATAISLQRWVGEEVLFPLSLIEYLAYSDYLTRDIAVPLMENNLALLLTLFFSAQAYLDMREGAEGDDLTIAPN
ncbi:MAG TPA: hypothetical protein VF398_05250 [bacterium]